MKRRIQFRFSGDGGAIQRLSMDGGAEEFCGDPTVGPLPKVWTKDQKWKK